MKYWSLSERLREIAQLQKYSGVPELSKNVLFGAGLKLDFFYFKPFLCKIALNDTDPETELLI